jgi:carbon-monoxide dehydrogenase small subunit
VQIDVKMTVNGKPATGRVEARTLLVQFIREHLKLTGTHVGCDTTQCGCCVVHVDGRAVKSCTMLAVQADGRAITTIEGLAAADGTLHPMQAAFREHHALQCGFCTPGMVMMGVDIARRLPNADEVTVREQLDGNICRCTGYQGIVEAIMSASRVMAAGRS